MLGGFTRSLSALVHFTLHKGAAVDSVVYMLHWTLFIFYFFLTAARRRRAAPPAAAGGAAGS